MKYFGTDGIRGLANGPVLRPHVIVKIGQAAAQVIRARCGHSSPTVVIGKDTRLSGYMIESSLQAAFTSMGFTCLLVGPLPTPAVAMLTRSLRADLGVMITASHNPYQDNGIKFFGPDGVKINSSMVDDVEALVDNPLRLDLTGCDHIGKAERLEDAVGRYIEFVKTSVPNHLRFDGVKLVVDCAHGAAYRIAPRIFWEMGADVVRLGTAPDGFNINDKVGATHPATLAAAVIEHQAHLGIALDGDADRLILVDERGEILDGDVILAAMAQHLKNHGKLQGGAVVATVMSNMGFEDFLRGLGVALHRTAVGDHYVEAGMRQYGCNLGGEQSGHLIFRDYATTGDGILAALQVLAFLADTGKKPSSLKALFTPWPQRLENIRLPEGVAASEILARAKVGEAIANAEALLGADGRVLVRKSGTEPLIRVMVEARTEAAVQQHLQAITSAVRGQLT
jgi:phosphoglucosamine mutase